MSAAPAILIARRWTKRVGVAVADDGAPPRPASPTINGNKSLIGGGASRRLQAAIVGALRHPLLSFCLGIDHLKQKPQPGWNRRWGLYLRHNLSKSNCRATGSANGSFGRPIPNQARAAAAFRRRR